MKLNRQEKAIFNALRGGKPMDRQIAQREYNVKALNKIISMLRKKGCDIDTDYVQWGEAFWLGYTLKMDDTGLFFGGRTRCVTTYVHIAVKAHT